jgi:hypothetical protein
MEPLFLCYFLSKESKRNPGGWEMTLGGVGKEGRYLQSPAPDLLPARVPLLVAECPAPVPLLITCGNGSGTWSRRTWGGMGNSRAADVADPRGMAAVHEDGRSGDRELANDRAEGPANAPRKAGRLSLVAAASGTAASRPI